MILRPKLFNPWRELFKLLLCLGVVNLAFAGLGILTGSSLWLQSLPLTVGSGLCFIGVCMWGLFRVPTALLAGRLGLRIRPRWGPTVAVRWEAIQVARKTNTTSDQKWVLECPEGDVTIRGTCLEPLDWLALSARIADEVSKRGGTVSRWS